MGDPTSTKNPSTKGDRFVARCEGVKKTYKATKMDDVVSTVTGDDLLAFRKKIYFSNDMVVKVPARSDRACSPPPRFVTVYEFSLRASLRFPPSPELSDILTICGVSLAQLSYRAMSIIMRLIVLFRDHGAVLSPDCLSRMGRLIGDTQGRISFRSKWLDIRTRDPLKSWISDFFYVKNDWNLLEKWGKLRELQISLHLGAEELLKILKFSDIDTLHYEVRYLSRYIDEEYLFKKSASFKIIVEDHIQEARNHIYDVEVKALEADCMEEGFIQGFMKGVRVVQRKTGAYIDGLTPSQASGDPSSDFGGEEIESEFPLAPELLEIFKACGVPLAQFLCRTVTIIVGLTAFYRERGAKLTVDHLSKMCRLTSDSQGRILCRGKKWLDFSTRDPSKNWFSSFFFVKNDWGLSEKWGRLKELPDFPHLGEEEILKTLNFSHTKSLQEELRHISQYVMEEKLFKVGLSIQAGRSHANRVQETYNKLFDAEARNLERQCLEEGFVRGFLKGARLVQRKAGVTIEGLSPSQASEDPSPDLDDDDVEITRDISLGHNNILFKILLFIFLMKLLI
ncbi:hypothetical protein IEQ34_007164 [Dendrobium chrysotoxum]|uniref:Uncharacterized protein n=1 Tax=Dendrobium chrysotoxum TaxID=161865 RepID=A0AAV7H9Z1_DENCH|nr:hypothetical protein IEQ34_007164 [Dendrobium chrysotoxum]